MAQVLKGSLMDKYGLDVEVSEPTREEGNCLMGTSLRRLN